MPELPEVETVARGLRQKAVGHRIKKLVLHRGSLRFPFPAHLSTEITGQKITGIARKSKYILMQLKDGGQILLHLGMSGRLFFHADDYQPVKHDHVQIYLDNGTCLIFNDARRFGVLDYLMPKQKGHKLLDQMGVDPFDETLTPQWLLEKFRTRKTPLKNLLMDQKIIAGLGNIYVCEALFEAKLWPERLGSTVTLAEMKKLVLAIRKVLNAALDAGGSSLRDYIQTTGEMGYFQNEFKVYGREGKACLRDKTPIIRLVQQGRSSFACPHCQK
jgi:formamidopyrimidine-DNA glycosylase